MWSAQSLPLNLMPDSSWPWVGVLAVTSLLFGSHASGAEEPRDPFTFGPRNEAAHQASTTLIGILWDAAHPLAMVGEQPVGIGDAVAGWQIIEIHQDSITVQRDTRRATITPGQALPQD